jgi:4-hydroxy-4-methyl-2-oxoglutarate aldolase
MALVHGSPISRLLSDEELAVWLTIPTSIVADELNRAGGMSAELRPLGQAERFVGEAVTAQIMVGDNLALHALVNVAPRGSVIVVDAGGFLGTAVWGEVLHTVAQVRGVAAVIVDGAIRDRDALRGSTIPVFARGSTPNGPHKGWGGSINRDIQCGGVKVSPNDVLLGDADGIVVVPRAEMAGLLQRCTQRILTEADAMRRIRGGESTLDLFHLRGAAS